MKSKALWAGVLKLVAAAGLGALGACGGGGGGDSPPPPAPLTVANVQVTAGADQEVFEGSDSLQPLSILADVQGDLSQLNGATIYVVVVDPDAVFDSQPVLQISSNGVGNRLTVYGRSSNERTGTFTGPLRVNVCRDAACATPLRGSPFSVPYRIKVLPVLRLDQAADATFQGMFASAAAPAWTSNVSLPGGATSFTASLQLLSGLADAVTVSQTDSAVVLTPGVASQGTHTYQLSVTAVGRTSAGRTMSFTRTRAVSYVVASNPAGDWLPSTTSLSFTIAANGGTTPFQRVEVYSADGEIYEVVSSMTFPAGGSSGNLAAPGPWLRDRSGGGSAFRGVIEFAASACSLVLPMPGTNPCMGPGRYVASVVLKSRTGKIAPRALDVVLTVTE